MKLEGIHHITAITGDAPSNVEFYAGVLGLRLVKNDEARLAARSPDIPSEHALQGFDGARAYSTDPVASARLLGQALAFQAGSEEGAWEVRGERHSSFYAYDAAPAGSRARQ